MFLLEPQWIPKLEVVATETQFALEFANLVLHLPSIALETHERIVDLH